MPRLRALIFVLPAVQLDDQHAFDAAEIHDVRTERMLATELHAQLIPAQMEPQATLSVSLFSTQRARSRESGGALIHED